MQNNPSRPTQKSYVSAKFGEDSVIKQAGRVATTRRRGIDELGPVAHLAVSSTGMTPSAYP